MISVHRDLKKHFHEGVVYEDNGRPLKLMIAKVNYGYQIGDSKVTFDLANRFGPRIPLDSRPCYGRVVLFKEIPPEKLFRNLTEYRKSKVEQNESRISFLKSRIQTAKTAVETCRKEISELLETEFFKKVLCDNFIEKTKEYQEGRKMTLPVFKSFFKKLETIDRTIRKHDMEIEKCKTELLESEKELKKLLDFKEKALRKERSFEIRRKWSQEQGGKND